MGGLPIPLVRLPWIEAKQRGFRRNSLLFLQRLCHIKEFPVTRKVVLKRQDSGCCSCVLNYSVGFNVFAVGFFLFYVLNVEKGYLERTRGHGASRVTLQHPVQKCNPLEASCRANFTALSDLAYCRNGTRHMSSLKGKQIKTGCRYVDEFDILLYDKGKLGNLLIPTRISTFMHNKMPCPNHAEVCTTPYKVVSESHDFVADIENFTLLIDHSFTTEDSSIKGSSRTSLGFYKTCPREGCEVRAVERSKDHPPTEEVGTCASKAVYCFFHWWRKSNTEARARREYDVVSGPGVIHNYPFGDIIKFSDLLKMAEINLDENNPEGNPWREEGKVVIIDIKYMNYREWKWPNCLPPVYEYVIDITSQDKFKLTNVRQLDDVRRVVEDVHGIHIITRFSESTIGRFNFQNMFISFLEVEFVLNLVHWILSCVALNLRGEDGDDFVKKVDREYEMPRDSVQIGSDETTDSESEVFVAQAP